MNLAFASGDLPDIVYGAGSNSLTSSMEIDYGSQGILLPLEEYITPEIMPNLYALTQEDPSILKVDHHTRWPYLFIADDFEKCDIYLVARSDVVQRNVAR